MPSLFRGGRRPPPGTPTRGLPTTGASHGRPDAGSPVLQLSRLLSSDPEATEPSEPGTPTPPPEQAPSLRLALPKAPALPPPPRTSGTSARQSRAQSDAPHTLPQLVDTIPADTMPAASSQLNDTLASDERLGWRGTVRLLLKNAEGLRRADMLGSSDPYVVFHLAGREVRSRTVKRSTSPQWFQLLDVKGVTLAEVLASPMAVVIFDQDKGSADDVLGTLDVPLDALAKSDSATYSLNIPKPNKGTIHFTATWLKLRRTVRDLPCDTRYKVRPA